MRNVTTTSFDDGSDFARRSARVIDLSHLLECFVARRSASMSAVHALKARLRDWRASLVARRVASRWRRPDKCGDRRPHGLDCPLIVSLTSFPPRYGSLLPTLQSLMMQSVKPNHLELWIAEDDFAALPQPVLDLQKRGLSIRTCENLRSYKKIIPALAAHPDAFIVTADDDAYYWPTWLEELIAAYDPSAKEVICHRGHQIVTDATGRPAPYRQWAFETPSNAPSRSVFPTGLGGVLYRPGIFNAEVSRKELFQKYCPTGDDIWLFWMAALNGAKFRKVGPVRRFILWPGGQEVALYNHNVVGTDANDAQIDAMIAAYGFPDAGEAK